jgi:hypothetical protein
VDQNSLCQVRDELEVVDDLTSGSTATLDAEGKDTAEAPLEILLRQLVGSMVLETWVGHPGNIGVGLQPLGKGKGVLRMSLSSQCESLNAEQELLSGEWVQGAAQVTENLDSGTDGEGDGAEGLPKLQAVVAFGWLDHLRESLSVLAPIELAAVNDDTSNSRAVASNPLGCRVDDNVRSVFNRFNVVATSSEGVVNLSVPCQHD